MVIGQIYLEADQAVNTDGPEFSGFLHSCVDGSHQWCREWEGNEYNQRFLAVMETYMALLMDYQWQLMEDVYLRLKF